MEKIVTVHHSLFINGFKYYEGWKKLSKIVNSKVKASRDVNNLNLLSLVFVQKKLPFNWKWKYLTEIFVRLYF